MKATLTFVLMTAVLKMFAQDCKVSAGTKTLYAPQQVQYAKVPSGYQPMFINHVGRHGARHLTKDLSATVAYRMLVKADSLDWLSAEGTKLLKMVSLLRTAEAPWLKSISQVGKNELAAIASRMVKCNAALFKQPALEVNVEVTKEIRTSQSANAFLTGLANKKITAAIVKKTNDTTLRFYDLSPAYTKFEEGGNWKQVLATIAASSKINDAGLQQFADKFFIRGFSMTSLDTDTFSKDIYGFAKIVPSISSQLVQAHIKTSDLDFNTFFSCSQLAALSKLDEAEDFLLKGPGTDTMGIQVKIAVPLLVDFINSSDRIINSGKPTLQLRFAHAETIAPFASLLQFIPASKSMSIPENFDHSWKAAEIVPLSANIQWIFYQKKGSTNFLVRFLLNEKEIAIKGLSSRTFPYYKWTDVRRFFIDLLAKLNTSVTGNMYTYLLQLK